MVCPRRSKTADYACGNADRYGTAEARISDPAAAKGRSSNLSGYYKNLAGLTQQQAEAMQAVSLAAVAELGEIDRQVQELILQARAQMRQQVLSGEKPTAPPAQLVALQSARNAVRAKYRANLAQALGQNAFSRLEQALIANYRVGPQATAPNPGTGR